MENCNGSVWALSHHRVLLGSSRYLSLWKFIFYFFNPFKLSSPTKWINHKLVPALEKRTQPWAWIWKPLAADPLIKTTYCTTKPHAKRDVGGFDVVHIHVGFAGRNVQPTNLHQLCDAVMATWTQRNASSTLLNRSLPGLRYCRRYDGCVIPCWSKVKLK